jgi:hypothetical protein
MFTKIQIVYFQGRDKMKNQGRIQGGRPPKIGKMFFWRKIVIFHTKYPKIFRASLRNCKNYDFLA